MSNNKSIFDQFNQIFDNFNKNIGDIIVETIKNTSYKMNRAGSEHTWGALDSMINNVEIYLGYVTGTLRNYFYTYFSTSTVYKGLKNYSWVYSQNLTKNKIVDELNHMLGQSDLYYRNFTPVVNNLIIPTAKLLYDRMIEVRESIYFFIKQNNDFAKANQKEISELKLDLNLLFSTFDKRVEEIVDSWLDVWYAYWDWWYQSQWLTLINALDNFKNEYELHLRQFDLVRTIVYNNVDDINSLNELLGEPVTAFLRLKDFDRSLYYSEIGKLTEIITDVMSLNYKSITNVIRENVNTIIPVVR